MDGLRDDVAEYAGLFVQEYLLSHIDKNDLFRSTGRAYVQLAREEPHILKIFLFRERKNITSLDALHRSETSPQMAQIIAKELNINVEHARRLHLNMLIYTIGIGTIFSVTTPGIPADEIYAQQEQAYQIFLKDALESENKEKKF